MADLNGFVELDPGWILEGASSIGDGVQIVCTGSNGDTKAHFLLEFEEFPRAALTTRVEGGGSVHPPSGVYNHIAGMRCTLTASPAPRSRFSHWVGAESVDGNVATVTLHEDTTVTAVFDLTRELTMKMLGQGSVVPSEGSHEFPYGSSVTLSATPASGWFFSHWIGAAEVHSNPTSILVDDDRTVIAVFEEHPYRLTMDVFGNGTIRQSPDQHAFPVGSSVTVTAVADEGWVFHSWLGDISGSENPATIAMSEDLHIIALIWKLILGDLNGDQAVNAVDVQLVINATLGIAGGEVNGDVNEDGRVDAIDIQSVINATLGGR